MNKKNNGGKLILIFGALSIIIVTICAFNKDTITHKYYEYTVEKQYGKTISEFEGRDWVKISVMQELSEDFIREFQDKLE